MVETDIHFRPLHTSILDIYKVFETLVCCLKGMWLHPYTVTLARLAPDLRSQVHLRSGNDATTSLLRLIFTSDHFILVYWTYTKCLSHWYAVPRAYGCILIPLHWLSCPQIGGLKYTWGVKMMPQCHGWGWYSPQTTSYIHIRHMQSVWAIGMLYQGHMAAPWYRYTGQVAPRFGDSGSLEEWNWCNNIMVEANIHLSSLHTSILDTCKVYETLICCLKGIWVHPYTFTPAKLPPDLGIQVHLRSGNDATTSWLRLVSTSDCFIHPY